MEAAKLNITESDLSCLIEVLLSWSGLSLVLWLGLTHFVIKLRQSLSGELNSKISNELEIWEGGSLISTQF